MDLGPCEGVTEQQCLEEVHEMVDDFVQGKYTAVRGKGSPKAARWKKSLIRFGDVDTNIRCS